MQKLISFYLIFVLSVLFYVTCSVDHSTSPLVNSESELGEGDLRSILLSKKPSPNLIGTTYTPFNFPPLPDPSGSNLPIFWKGTIDFGEDTYGIYFLSHEEPRGYSQASPYYENFVIHEDGNEGNVYMRGWNAGVVTYANSIPDPVQFLANGKIEEAYGPFVAWQGHNMHIRGLVYWEFENGVPTGLPERAEGSLRIN
jgi:hypothetical protein